MSKLTRIVLVSIVAVIVLVVIAGLALPLFLNADSFRNRIEANLTQSLGRKVSMSKLNLSVWSGGLVAQNVTIADDPRFSTQPFLQADSVKIRVELFPLLLHREVRIKGFALDSPKVDLLRGASGTWNYSTIGSTANKPAAAPANSNGPLGGLTAGHIEITNGSITVGDQGNGGAAAQERNYQQVSLDIKDFGSAKAFPFELSAHLPGEGTITAKGTAGPINERDSSNTPFTVHMEAKHIDPLAAGLVDASAGISGLVDSITVDAAWTGEQLHVAKVLVGSPHMTLVQTAKPKQPTAQPAKKSTFLENLSVDDGEISNGSVTLTTPGKAGAPVVYQQISAKLSNLTPTTSSPFTLSAQLPGGGSLSANGKAGPFNQANNAATPLDAQVALKRIQLGTAGILPPDAGINGVMDLQAQVQSNGQTLQANGKAQVDGIKLARNASPSPKPLDVQFAVTKNEQANNGVIQHAVVSVGAVALNIAGTFESTGPSTAVNLKVVGNGLSIDAIEAFLPAIGVRLPQGSQLRGGTLTTSLAVTGSTAAPTIAGPVRLDNTELAGFNLGAKLGPLQQLTGGKIGAATGNGTPVRLLSMDLREAGGNIRTDKVNLEVTGIGTATGNGTVSESGALDYAMLLKLTGLSGGGHAAPAAGQSSGGLGGLAGGLGGLIPGGAGKALGGAGGIGSALLSRGIPVQIGGTTSNPTFAPNLKGLVGGIGAGALQQAMPGKQGNAPTTKNPGDQLKKSLGGFLGH